MQRDVIGDHARFRRRLSMAAGLGALVVVAPPVAADQINALVWCDHADAALLEPFEQEHGVRVNVQEYEGTGTGLAIVEQSRPGDWDVMVIDSIDIRRGVERGLFAPLPEDQLPFDDLYPEVRMEQFGRFDGQWYGITEKFGYNAISFNGNAVSAEDMRSLSTLGDEHFRGRIAIYDYYLPVIGLAALAAGRDTATLTADDLPAIHDVLMEWNANTRLVGEVVASQTALATGEVDILIGGGEWVTAVLAAEIESLDFSIPEEGGILWSQSLAMFADSERPELALKFIQYVMSPEGQARLATSSCYWGMPASRSAALTDEQRGILRADEQPAFLARAHLYPAPDDELDLLMQDLWTEMLQAR